MKKDTICLLIKGAAVGLGLSEVIYNVRKLKLNRELMKANAERSELIKELDECESALEDMRHKKAMKDIEELSVKELELQHEKYEQEMEYLKARIKKLTEEYTVKAQE